MLYPFRKTSISLLFVTIIGSGPLLHSSRPVASAACIVPSNKTVYENKSNEAKIPELLMNTFHKQTTNLESMNAVEVQAKSKAHGTGPEAHNVHFETDGAVSQSRVEMLHAHHEQAQSNNPLCPNKGEAKDTSGASKTQFDPNTSSEEITRTMNRNSSKPTRNGALTIQNAANTAHINDDEPEVLTQRSRRAVTSVASHVWPSGIIPYEIEPRFSDNSKAMFLKGMRIWESLTCLSFVKREQSHMSYIIFTVEPCGCCSNVGRQHRDKPQKISIAPSCESQETVIHELGHVLGFWHEHSRPDRDSYVKVLTENIEPKYLHNFDIKDEVDSLNEPYDFNSIMSYQDGAAARPNTNETVRPIECCPRPEIGGKSMPSKSDASQMNKLYRCPSCGQTFVANAGSFSFPKRIQMPVTENKKIESSRSTLHSQGQVNISNSEAVLCQWRILASSGERIHLFFTRIAMLPPANLPQGDQIDPGHTDSCINEYVEIRDGYHAKSPLLGRFCGTTLPSKLISQSSRMMIEYKRSAGESSNGFSASYRVVCGGTLKRDKGTITSPGFPSIYLPDKECIWKIQVPAGFSIALTFDTFDLEPDKDCSFDYIEIFDGLHSSSPVLQKLCGTDLPKPIWSTSNKMSLRFVNFGAIERKGFEARFEKVVYADIDFCATPNHGCEHICENVPGNYICRCRDGYKLLADKSSCQLARCGGNLKMEEGKITSPGYPEKYTPGLNCIWVIEVPSGYSVALTFTDFEVENDAFCSSDYVEFTNGPLGSVKPVKFCGSIPPKPIRSTTNIMTLRFVSDDSWQVKGFAATFQKASMEQS